MPTTAQLVEAAEARGDLAEAQRLRDAWSERAFGDRYDEDLAESAFFIDARIIEHDAYCCCDEVCDAAEDRRALRALNHEIERRVRLGIHNPDPNYPTFEERYAPFGSEWEREQRARVEAR